MVGRDKHTSLESLTVVRSFIKQDSDVNFVKLFTSSLTSRQNRPECSSLPSLIITSKARAYPCGAARKFDYGRKKFYGTAFE